MVIATNDVRDAHVHVINNDAEVVGRRAVRAADDQVIQLFVLERHGAVNQVVHHHRSIERIAETHDRVDSRARLRLLTANARIARLLFARDLLLAHGLELLLRAVAVIRRARVEHAADDFPVAVEALRLVVRALVGIQVEPGHALENHPHGLIRGPFAVGVLDPQDELAAHAACVQPAEESRPDASHMKHAGRAGCESGNYCHEPRGGAARPAVTH